MGKIYRFEIWDKNNNFITFYAVRALSLKHAKYKTIAWLRACYSHKNPNDLELFSLL